MEPTPAPPPAGSATSTRMRWLLAAAGVIIVALAVALVIVLADDDDDEDVTAGTTTTEQVTTTTEADEPTSTTAPDDRWTISEAEAATVVWPAPVEDGRYDDPMEAARGFAEDLVGFEDPVYGGYMAGDSRSGEIEVRPVVDGPVTTVLVRQMSDQHWYVLGSATEDVELTQPSPGSAIDHPLQVAGRARAFEGQVRVAVYERGDTDPLGEGFVTAGSGPDLEPFEGEVAWDNPGGGWGAVVATTADGQDGGIWSAAALPVGFIGGD